MSIESLTLLSSILVISISIYLLLKYSHLFKETKAVVLYSFSASVITWGVIFLLAVEYGLGANISKPGMSILLISLFSFTILAFSLVFYNLKNIEQDKNSLGYFISSIVAGVFLVAIQCSLYLEFTGFDTYILNNTLLFAVLHTVITLFLLTRVLQQVRFDQLHSPAKVKNVSLVIISIICGHSLFGSFITVIEAFSLTVNYDLFNVEYVSAILLFAITVAQGERQYLDERAKLNYLAYHDSLTGLYNRSYMQESISKKTGESRSPFHVLLLDLDYFKHINDTHGHFFGDEVLIKVSSFIKSKLGPLDRAGRLGGDEFVIFYHEEMNELTVEEFCESILDYLSNPLIINDRQITVTTSIGVASYPENAETPGELLVKADISMYKTKGDGRNSYTIFNRQLEEEFNKDITLQADLSKALLNKEFEVYYQPVVSLKDKKVVGFEALLRWNHPEKGMVSPGEFIHIAEETGMIVSIGEWVVREACRQIHDWNRQLNQEYTISVNLSLKQFSKKDIFEVLWEIITDSGISPSLVTIEITESMAMVNTAHTLSLLEKFRENGIGISIDDLGTGYSSLSYLKDFSIQSIKIDRSFIKSVNESGKDDAIVKAIMSIAENLGIEVVAEGVELPQQEHFLLREQCRYAQGYHYSRPLNSSDLLKYLEGNSLVLTSDPALTS
ncbi:bifunctional diguanylate cyclase/phosphodiesterase [Rossellomorea vietnamensis]|uniref:Bifunctional diguanylate cyclase/phosphodiesterase n=1 Tax=Rossellomorea vietnamensis TaxID=218284 RepID=A0A5D4KKA9_9BACI|nr:bifunctional diguanylate cyclase/phosphodiesterase [Rossellomorea vietnamensis]TYR77339.1 bifunctional diguanylate cyclase/phosphodiesterase [Rossellomorea vietnamensis]